MEILQCIASKYNGEDIHVTTAEEADTTGESAKCRKIRSRECKD